MTPLVTVIMPSYNHEKYVGAAAQSVLAQSFRDYEFLISDDGSSDSTVEEIKKLDDPRISLHVFEKNMGAAVNHRYLIDRARGKYLALINSDDIWLDGRLEKGVAYLERHPACDACFSWAELIDEDGRLLEGGELFRQPNRTQAEWYAHFFRNGNCLCHPSILIRTEAYPKLGFYNPALRQLPDFELWIRLVKHGSLHVLQEPLVRLRRFVKTGGNTSALNLDNYKRNIVEADYLLRHYFDGVEDALFAEAFQSGFRRAGKLTHDELLCEKFFLLLGGTFYMPALSLPAAIDCFIGLCARDGMAETFRASYGFAAQDFYDLTGKPDPLGVAASGISFGGDCVVTPEAYIGAHKLRALRAIFFNRQSRLYRFCKKLYLRARPAKTR